MLKTFAKEAYSKVPFPYRFGLTFTRFYLWLMKTQWLKTEEIEKIKNKQLRKIIRHAYHNVPYYHKIFKERQLTPDDIKTKEDLKLLPILTKDDVRKKFRELIAKNAENFKPFICESGGTTGKPLKFLRDKPSSTLHECAVWRYRNYSGFKFGERWVVMRYPTFTESHLDVPYDIKRHTMYLSSFHMRYNNIERYLKIIEKFKPKAIWGFPSTLYVMAKFIENTNIKFNVKLKAVFTSSETLFKHFRELIENSFQTRIYDWYGSNEGIISAGQCENGNYHINEDGIIEIIDFNGEVCGEEEEGKVVGTSLWNYAMPLIRYELGDIASISHEKCKCGRGLPTLKVISGRLDDIIITKDERLVGRLDEAFHYSTGIRESQIIQNEIGKILIKIVKDINFSDKDIKLLDVELRKRLGEDMDISYEITDEIPKTRRGKYRFVISTIIRDYLKKL
ncbi:MAG: phenylacetate--CoA ligase family protein [Candidatus Odinarchaeia archaeon]